ncbi:MAG: hypothetical protein JWM11_8075, partial [Planctomycetaceae bacterium]|nr:hypothetical protein [Planctomycetaceae bacterium]
MTIRVECSECGRVTSVADKAAGRKLKCSCGSAVTVPELDDEEELFDNESRASRSRSRRRSSRNAPNPFLLAGLIGGGALAGLVLVFMLFRTATSFAVWQLDPSLSDSLGAEQSAAGFVIRPPKGWRIVARSSQTATSGTTRQADQVRWFPGQGQGGEISLDVHSHPSIRGKTQPSNLYTSAGSYTDSETEPLIVVLNGSISRGKINDRITTRLAFSQHPTSINLSASTFPNGLLYVTYFDDKRVALAFSCPFEPSSLEFRVLEESLKTLRPAGPNDAQSAQPFTIPSTVNANLAANSTPGPQAVKSGFKPLESQKSGFQPFQQSGVNGSGDSTANGNATPTQNLGAKETAKSGFANATKPAAKSGFKNADWGGGDATQKGTTPGKQAEWGGAAEIIAQTEGTDTLIEFPATESPFVLVGKGLHDIRTGERTGEFPIGAKNIRGQFRALSPDGKLLASAGDSSSDTGEMATLNELGGKGFGKTLKTNDVGRARESVRVKFIEFSASNR